MKYTAVIIDDEFEARNVLKTMLSKYVPEVSVIGEGTGVVSGLSAINNLQPDVVFLDVKMNDGTGFDLLQGLEQQNFKLIFTTAFDNFALKAFKYSAIDYLLKPINPEELKLAIDKLEVKNIVTKEQVNIAHSFNQDSSSDKIAFHTKSKIHIKKLEDIIHFKADGGYTDIFMIDDERLTTSKSLGDYDSILESPKFFRVHHSYIINIQHVKMVLKDDGGSVVMSDDSRVPISRRRKNELYSLLNL